MDAVAQGERGGMAAPQNAELAAEMGRIEEVRPTVRAPSPPEGIVLTTPCAQELRRRLPIGWNTSLATLRREFVDGRGYDEQALARVLGVMQRRESIQMRTGGSAVYRTGP